MNDDTIQLLRECNSGCKMAVESMEQVSEYTTDEKLLHLLKENIQKHKELEAVSVKRLLEEEIEGKEPGAIAASFAWLSTEIKLLVKDDNRQIAKIMMDGCNMGIQSISKFQNQYFNAARDTRDIAKRLVAMEEDFMKKLECFL